MTEYQATLQHYRSLITTGGKQWIESWMKTTQQDLVGASTYVDFADRLVLFHSACFSFFSIIQNQPQHHNVSEVLTEMAHNLYIAGKTVFDPVQRKSNQDIATMFALLAAISCAHTQYLDAGQYIKQQYLSTVTDHARYHQNLNALDHVLSVTNHPDHKQIIDWLTICNVPFTQLSL